METEDSLLDLLHGELKAMIARTITPAWKARVLEVAKAEPREYNLVGAFRQELETAFRPIAVFPEKYSKCRGKIPCSDKPLETDIERTRRYLDEQEIAARRALAERQEPGAEEIVRAAVSSLPWRKAEPAVRGAA